MHLSLKTKLTSDILWLTLSKVCVVITGLIGLRILTELASPEIFGEANLLLGLVALGIQFFCAPFFQSIIRLLPEAIENGEATEFIKSSNKLITYSVILLSLILIAVSIFDIKRFFPSFDFQILLILLGYIVCFTIKSILTSILSVIRSQKLYSFWLALEAILTLFFISIFLWQSATTASFLLGHFCGLLTCIAINYFIVRKLNLINFSSPSKKIVEETSSNSLKRLSKSILIYGWPWIIFALLNWLAITIDRYIVAAHLDVFEAGKYVAIFSVASRLASFPAGIIHQAFRPIVYQAVSKKSHEKWKNACSSWLATLAFSGITIVIFSFLAGKLIISSLLADDYQFENTHFLLVIMVCAGIALSFVQALEMIILSKKTSSALVFPKIIGAIGTLSFCAWLIPIHGLTGAAYGTLFGLLFSFIILILSILFPKFRFIR